MINQNTDFFQIVDNFSKTKHIPSIPIIINELGFLPKITIGIPTYKRTALLKETLDSALNQTNYNEYEILVVDNNPTRDCATERLLINYKNKKISYFKNAENLGMVENWNRIYTLSKGEYVIMLHDDDLLYSDYLNYISQFFIKMNDYYDVIYPPIDFYNQIYQGKKPVRKTKIYFQYLNLKVFDFLWGNITGTPVGMCIKRSSFLITGGFDSKFFPSFDYAMNVKMAYRLKCCKLFGYSLCTYRISENESSISNILKKFVKSDCEIKWHILQLIDSKLLKWIWNRYFNVFAYHYLKMMTQLFGNKDININSELTELGLKKTLTNNVIYYLMNFYKRIYFKVSKINVR